MKVFLQQKISQIVTNWKISKKNGRLE